MRKFWIYSPNIRWLTSQLYRRSEERNHSAAARSSSGVVGSSGRKIPATASAKESVPSIAKIIFTAQIYKIRINFVYL